MGFTIFYRFLSISFPEVRHRHISQDHTDPDMMLSLPVRRFYFSLDRDFFFCASSALAHQRAARKRIVVFSIFISNVSPTATTKRPIIKYTEQV